MILRSYRSDHPAPALFLPLLIALLWLVVPFKGPAIPEHTGMPLHEGLQGFCTDRPWLGWSIGYLLAVSGSFLCLLISRDLEFPDRHGSLPALLYPLIMALYPSSLWAHPAAFSNVFLLFAFWRTMKVHEAHRSTPFLFDAGFSIGLAALFHLPALFVFPFIWIGGFILRTLTWRDVLWPLIGLSLPLIFLWTSYFWNGQSSLFFASFHSREGFPVQALIPEGIPAYAMAILIGIFFLLGLFLMAGEAQRSNIQGKKLRSAFLLFLLLMLGTSYLAFEFYGDRLAWGSLAAPFAFLFVPIFAKGSIGHLSPFFLYLWLLVLLWNHYGSSYF